MGALLDQWKKRKEGGSTTEGSLLERWNTDKKYRDVDTSVVNDAYFESYNQAANDFFSKKELHENSYDQWQGLTKQADTIRAWAWQNRDKLSSNYDAIMSATDLSEAGQYWGQFGSAEDYAKAFGEYTNYQEMMNADLGVLEQEISEWEERTERAKKRPFDNFYKTNSEVLAKKRAYYNEAKNIQAGKAYEEQARLDPEFARLAEQGSVGVSDGMIKNRIAYFRSPESEKDIVARRQMGSYDYLAARLMTDDEFATYNYLLAKGDKDGAEEYLQSLKYQINQRGAANAAANLKGRTVAEIAWAIPAGLDQFGSGLASAVKGVFGEDGYMTPSAIQMSSGKIREDLADDGVKVFGSSAGQLAYDTLSTTANMAPSILAAAAINFVAPGAGAYVGAGLMGASAGGNAYAEALNNGYSGDNALAYGLFVGASEAALQSVLGGISSVSGVGNLTAKVAQKADAINNALLRVAAKYGISVLGETTEEELQNFLEPLFKTIFLGEEYDMPTIEELVQTAIVTALSTGILESGGIVSSTINENKTYKDTYGEAQKELVAEGLELDPQSRYYQRLNEKLNRGKDLSGNEIRNVVTRNERAISRLGKDAESADVAEIAEEEAATDTTTEMTAQNAPKIAQERTEIAETQTATESENAPAAKQTDAQAEPVSETAREDAQSALEKASRDYGAQAKAMVATYIEGQDVAEYNDAFRIAYDMGASGVNLSYVEGMQSYLTESQKKIAYEAGKASQDTRAKRLEKSNAKKVTGGTQRKKGVVRGQGVSIEELSAKFNDTQRQAYTIMSSIAEVTGVDIVLYKSEADAKGNFTDAQGKYKKSEPGTLYIDINAGLNNIKSAGDLANYTMLRTFSHEFVHFIENWNPVWYNELRRAVFDHLENADELISREAAESGLPYERASREVVAEALTDVLPDSTFLEDLANNHKSIFEKLYAKLKEFVENIKKHFASLSPNANKAAQSLKQSGKYAEDIVKLFDKAAAGAVENYQATVAEQKAETDMEEVKSEPKKIDQEKPQKEKKPKKIASTEAVIEEINADGMVEIDTDGKTVAPQYSRRTWTESEYVTDREKTAKAISKELGVSVETALSFIDNINAVSKLIADDKARLDYSPNAVDSASVLKPNSEYKWSVDMSTLCAKRLLFTGTFDAIQKIMADTAFDSEDIVRIRQMMEERGYEVACGFCYVESTRRELGPITQDFIERYKLSQKTGKPISRINSEGKEVELTKTKDQMKTTVDVSTDKFFPEDGYTPTMADLNTTDIDLVKKNHPQVYEAYLNFMNARGQAKPKLLETRAEYKGEILRTFKSKSAVTSRNNSGGLRLQSFSDFEVPHLIDMMQIALDMSRVGLKSQAYTKVPAFAKVFGNTGIKINLSLVAKGSGLDADGNLIFDDKEGMPHEEAFRLRDRFSKNVGTILVGKNDAHIIAAMADARIDFIIPFHKSSWKESLYDALGLTGYEDYTDTQNERSIDPERKIKNYDPSEYWDFSKTGDENAQIYLERCKQDSRIPKFPQFQSYPGYWKLLIDFKMYDNDGVGSPQEVVRPIYDEQSQADIKEIFDTYKGGHGTLPVAQDVVDDFVKEYEDKKGVQYSRRAYTDQDQAYMNAVESTDIRYQRRDGRMTDEEVLAYAVDMYERDPIASGDLSKSEKNALELFKQRLAKLDGLIEQRAEQGTIYRENTFQKGGDRSKAEAAHNRMQVLDEQIARASAQLLDVKQKTVLQGVLKKARSVVEQQERARGDEKLKRWRERRENAAAIKKYRDRIIADYEDLVSWLNHPLNKDVTKHVNENIKGILIPFLLTIDITSKQQLRGGEATKADQKHVAQAQKLLNMLHGLDDEVRYSGEYDLPLNFDDRLAKHINTVQELMEAYEGETVLNRMTAEELKNLSVLMANLKAAITTLNKFHTNAMFQHVSSAGDATVQYLKGLQQYDGNAVDSFFFWKNIRPDYAWERFGEGGQSINLSLRAGQSKLAWNAKAVIAYAHDTFTAKEREEWENTVVEVALSDGRKVKATVAALMSFYELSKRRQGALHILNGGITVADVEIRDKALSKKKRISGRYHKLTDADIKTMISALTDRQREVADALQQFMEKQGGEWGNHVTLARFGEKAFGEKGYFPISVDKQSLSTKPDQQAKGAELYRLLNMGFTKELSENTKQPLLLHSIFDVFSTHMADMAQYNAMALPVLDAIRWLNYKEYDLGDGTEVNNLRAEMKRAFGSPVVSGGQSSGYAERFVTHILEAYNGTEAQGTPGDSLGMKMLHTYNRAQIAFNMRVVVQQPMALTRAAMVIEPKYIVKALDPKKLKANVEDMLTHSGIAAWKDLGYYDINISRGLAQMIKQESTFTEKVTEIGLKPAEWADKATWAVIWAACKEQLAAKGITDYKDIERLFDDVIYKTQVVDSVLTKSEFMRDKGFFARSTSSFMSEPTTTASMVLDAYDQYRMDMRRGMSARQAWNAHKRNIGRTVLVYAVGAIMLAAVQAAADGLRDDDDYQNIAEKWDEAFWSNLLDELSPLNKLPLVSTIWELFKVGLDTFTNLDVYGNPPSAAWAQWFDTLAKAWEITMELSGGETNYTWYAAIYKYLQVASGLSGMPFAAFTREVITVWNNSVGAFAPSLKVKSYELKEQTEIKYALMDGYLTAEEAAEELWDQGLVGSREEAQYTAEAWDFVNQHPEYSDLTVTAYVTYKENCNGVDIGYFYQAWKYYNQAEADRDRNGDPIAGSKKRKVLDFIYQMNITAEQKKKIIKCFYK